MERKHFIDNLRILCILLLFPFHVGMFYNDFGERFYVHIADCLPASLLNISTYPWWMPLLFILAGASTFYAFEKRTAKQYIIERVLKLYIPFNAALIFVIPVQPYLADIFFNNYSGNYFEHFKEFFVFTDFTGYDGHFTPAQTWFILCLFLISLITLPLLKLAYNKNFDLKLSRFIILKLLLIGVIPFIVKPIGNLGGKSIAEFMAWFLTGFFVFSNETFQEKAASWSIVTFPVFAILLITRCVMYKMQFFPPYWDVLTYIFTWSGILSLFGLGKKFLNFNSAFTKYFSQASYSLYILHQSVIVILGFFAAKYVKIPYILQYLLIVLISFVITVGLYEIFRRNRVTGFLLGIKKKEKSKQLQIYTAALVGTGRIGFSLGFDKKREQPASHTMALLGNKSIKLIAAADTNEENLSEWGHYVKGAKTFSSSTEMYNAIPTPDILTIAVNEDSHMQECLAAIAAKPRLIILEKPVALNSAQAIEIAQAAEKDGVPVMVNHERRFAEDYKKAKEYIKEIGKLQTIRGELYSGLRIYGKEYEKDGSYSLLHDGTHLVDIISWLLDEKLSKPLVTGIYKDEKDEVRNFSAHFKTETCAEVTISMSGRSRFFSFGLDILGTEGRICLGNGYAKFYKRKESKLYSGFYSLSKDKSIHLPKKTGYFSNMVQNAVDFLDETQPLQSPLSAAIEDLKVLEEIKSFFI